MSKRFGDLKVLLIQIRAEKIAAVHERQCVLEMTGLDLTQLDSVNVTAVDGVSPERYQAADAVMIGGSGSNSVVNDDPFTAWLIDDVKRLVDLEIPLLGSCWGHQFIARALGGDVVHDPAKGEVGVHVAQVTAAAAEDPVFDHLPESFPVLMGHHDRVATLPPGATELVHSELCRNQAFKMDGLPVYGTQFHSEMTPEQLVERLTQFRQYMPDDREFEAMKSRIRPTTEASRILPRFLEMSCR
jgi:GMP synthase (glutamine-hydrolysing)